MAFRIQRAKGGNDPSSPTEPRPMIIVRICRLVTRTDEPLLARPSLWRGVATPIPTSTSGLSVPDIISRAKPGCIILPESSARYIHMRTQRNPHAETLHLDPRTRPPRRSCRAAASRRASRRSRARRPHSSRPGTYLITGGSGGIGSALVSWLLFLARCAPLLSSSVTSHAWCLARPRLFLRRRSLASWRLHRGASSRGPTKKDQIRFPPCHT